MQTTQNISPDFIIQNVSKDVDDPEFKKGISKGWYMGKLRDFLNEIGFDAQFQVTDLDDFVPANFRYPLPQDMFDLRAIYLWNGTCCTPSLSVRMRWKVDFDNSPNGLGYTATRKDDVQAGFNDAFNPMFSTYYAQAEGANATNVFYYNIQSGVLMFSSNSNSYAKFRITYSQVPVSMGATPFIPIIFEKGSRDYLKMEYLNFMANRDPRAYTGLYEIAKESFYNDKTGSYWKCIDRTVRLNRAQRKDLKEYQSRGNWGSFSNLR